MEKFFGPPQDIRPPPPDREDVNTSIIVIMDNSVDARIQEVEVKFFPPLHEQRRSWVLEILRREGVKSVGRSTMIVSGFKLSVSHRYWTLAAGRVSSANTSRTLHRGGHTPPRRPHPPCSKNRTTFMFASFMGWMFRTTTFRMRST